MKRSIYFTTLLLSLVFILQPVSAQTSQEKKDAKKIEEEAKIQKELAKQKQQQALEVKRQYLQQREQLSEDQLQEIEEKVQELQNEKLFEIQEKLRDIDLRHLRHIAEIELPEMPDIEIPNIEIPDIELHMPEMDFDFNFDFEPVDFEGDRIIVNGDRVHYIYTSEARRLFSDLAEDEELKIQAIHALDKKNTTSTLPTLHKIIREEASPAIRYTAVKKLRYFLADESSIDLLGKIARDDPNMQVRKAAIQVLGKCDNPKAKQILLDITKQE